MVTEIINAEKKPAECLIKAIDMLRTGNIVAFPTETVYGVGVDIYNTEAIQKIFSIKNRPFSKPLAAHVSSIEMAESILESPPPLFFKLAEKYLPGPLSIITFKKYNIPLAATAGGNTIAIRFPDSKITIDLINKFGRPLAATSANLSGGKFAVTAIEVYKSMKSLIPIILDTGITKYAKESTVIDLTENPVKIVREGAIPAAEILQFIYN
ncbi:MAG: L-threonylcarbamoyladenylate synthase [Candidatus Kapabacteria bacterium]|nr:L-threonylcarbamoyladenylate synthase [Candidatus Kapabacteria bacterium]